MIEVESTSWMIVDGYRISELRWTIDRFSSAVVLSKWRVFKKMNGCCGCSVSMLVMFLIQSAGPKVVALE